MNLPFTIDSIPFYSQSLPIDPGFFREYGLAASARKYNRTIYKTIIPHRIEDKHNSPCPAG
jgi:hypothetical protein